MMLDRNDFVSDCTLEYADATATEVAELENGHANGRAARLVPKRLPNDLVDGVYVSGDEVERAMAAMLGYLLVCQHVSKIERPWPGETVVFDFDHALFDAREETLLLAMKAADEGLFVGIHTYFPENPRLNELAKRPNVAIATTHVGVLAELRRIAAR